MKINNLISNSTKEDLENFCTQIPTNLKAIVNNVKKEIWEKAVPLSKMRDQNQKKFFNSVESIIINKISNLTAIDQNIFRRTLIAYFALELPGIVRYMNLPDSILALYPNAFIRLKDHLKKNQDDAYDLSNDFFLKDINFTLGISVPCGAQMVYMRTFFMYRSILRAFLRPGNITSLLRFFQNHGTGPWFSIHTELRNLTDFNEMGWDNCYLRIADLLKRYPAVRGMIGSSWFYDPQLLLISPHLSYLQKRPIERGAFMVRHSTSAVDIERATLKSKKRLELYNKGKYTPVPHTLFWPRNQLISWALAQ